MSEENILTKIWFPTDGNHQKPPLSNWERFNIEDAPDFAVFVLHKKEETNFKFVVIDEVAWTVNRTICLEAEIYCWGEAYFDGIRHFYLGDSQTNNPGYVYHLEPDEMIKVMNKLKELLRLFLGIF